MGDLADKILLQVFFTTHITTFNVDTFLKPQQDAYIAALQQAAGSNTRVEITRIVSGSVIVTTSVIHPGACVLN
jgi:hypothetical protein